jgi:hypothetical protein
LALPIQPTPPNKIEAALHNADRSINQIIFLSDLDVLKRPEADRQNVVKAG